jgi:hypothetical protein
MHIKGGKIFARELTEEEKAEAEALKSKWLKYNKIYIDKKPGGPPAKEDKNKKPGEEVLSPEEKERIERE